MTKGGLFVISGPSGVGKSTVIKKALELSPETVLSVSATTRAKREGEAEGVNYYYKTVDKFNEMIENDEFMEWAKFCENFYGTPRKPVLDNLNSGKDVILEIETCGAMKIMDKYPQAITIFILPPSIDTLKKRLTDRGTETDEVIRERLAVAEKEISLSGKYTYNIINDTVEQAAGDIITVMKAELLKTSRKNLNYDKERGSEK